jgi:hypothetical protein
MRAQGFVCASLLLLSSFLHKAYGDDAPAPPNPILTQKAEEVIKKSMRVLKEEEGVVALTLLPNGQALANKTLVIFFRRKRARMEIVANGVVTGERKNAKGVGEILVDIDRDTIVKYPEKGDFALPLADPNALGDGDKKDQFDYLVPEEAKIKKENDRPGYLEFGMGLMFGTLNSDSSDTANDDKKTSGYRFKDVHLAYYSEYVPLGFDLDTHSGNFPTSTYGNTVVNSSESVSNLAFAYRFPTLLDHKLSALLKINFLSDQFTTDNSDEHVLNTKITGMGFGLRVNYDFVSPVWVPEHAKVAFAFQQLFAEFYDYPSLSAVDSGVVRGTSSVGSTGTQSRLGFTSLAYFKFIPIFKRFVFQGSYGVRTYDLKFQGASTVSPLQGFSIPQNGMSHESESDFRFFVGIRIDDPLKLLLAPNKKEKSEPTP